MNRAERRRKGLKNKEPVYNIKASDVQSFREQERADACNKAFILMLAIPAVILHDKFSQIMPKKNRLNTFISLCLDLYDSYDKGYVDISELHQLLWEEAGIKIIEEK